MEMEGIEEVYKFQRFLPTHQEALTYFLPRLLAGETLPYGADKLIHHAEVYACEPKDLARQFAPVPTAVSTGDRFFFTTCKGKNGRFTRRAGVGSWTINKTQNVYHGGAKIGEARSLSFRKDRVSTGWVMEEFRCLLPEAVVDGGEKVLCKIHLAPTAPAAARQESAAYKLRQEPAEPAPALHPQPVTVAASEHARKRPAPIAAAADPSSCKKMRIAAPVPEPGVKYQYEDCPMWSTPAAPVSSPAASTEALAAAEADDDTGRFSCSWEIFGEQQQEQPLPVEAENNIEQLVFRKDMDQIDIDELAAPIDWESLDLQSLLGDDFEEEEELAKWCNYNAEAGNLHAPSLQGQNQFSFGAVN